WPPTLSIVRGIMPLEWMPESARIRRHVVEARPHSRVVVTRPGGSHAEAQIREEQGKKSREEDREEVREARREQGREEACDEAAPRACGERDPEGRPDRELARSRHAHGARERRPDRDA